MGSLGLERFRTRRACTTSARGVYAWLAPDGSWGWSNAGLVADGERSLLVDTLFDLPLTREMLAAMRRAEPRAAAASTLLVNTHANGDHCYGNQLVAGRRDRGVARVRRPRWARRRPRCSRHA